MRCCILSHVVGVDSWEHFGRLRDFAPLLREFNARDALPPGSLSSEGQRHAALALISCTRVTQCAVALFPLSVSGTQRKPLSIGCARCGPNMIPTNMITNMMNATNILKASPEHPPENTLRTQSLCMTCTCAAM